MLSAKFLDAFHVTVPVLQPIKKEDFIEFLKTQDIDNTLMSYVLTSDFVINAESTPRSWLMLNRLLLKSINGKSCVSQDDVAVIKQCANNWIGTTQSTLFMKHLLGVVK